MKDSLAIKMSPVEEARDRIRKARDIQDAADKQVGKRTGEPETPDTPIPHVWVVMDEDLKRIRRFTGNEGFTGALPALRAYLKQAIPIVERYIVSPHIVDDFPSHRSRLKWFKEHLSPYGSDVVELAGQSKLALNQLFQLQSIFTTIASMTKDLDCEEAKYMQEVVSNIGKIDQSGEFAGLPDVIKLFSGSKVVKDTKPLVITPEVQDEIREALKALKAGTLASQPPPKSDAYDVMGSQEKWKFGYEYLIVCRKLLEKIDLSEKAAAQRRAQIRRVV